MSDREKLIELLDNISASAYLFVGKHKYKEVFADEIADYLIENGVTFQKIGKWIKDDDLDSEYYGWFCSECGTYRLERTTCCPYCGAKMSLEE